MRAQAFLPSAVLCVFCTASAFAYPPDFDDSLVVSDLTYPTCIAFVPDGRVLVGEIDGHVRVIQSGTLDPTPLLALAVENFEEQGLLGMALDPAFPDSAFLYVCYTPYTGSPTNNHNRISRFTLSGATVVPGSERILFADLPTGLGFHVAGCLRVTPDRHLFASDGDNGSGQQNRRYAQDLSRLEGKLIRLDLDGTVPADNPFVGVAGARPEIYQYGLRNPFRFRIRPGTGVPYIDDVGSSCYDEIDRGPAGANFGWPDYECNPTPPNSGTVDPIYQEYIPPMNGSALAGSAFCTSSLFPSEYQGNYFFLNHVRGHLGRAVLASDGSFASVDPTWGETASSGWGFGPVDLEQGPDGALYYTTFDPGALRRIGYRATTAVDGRPTMGAIELAPSVPNPFRSRTSFRVTLPAERRVSVAIYDIGGRRVRSIANATMSAGPHALEWDGRGDGGEVAPAGIYQIRVAEGGVAATRRIALVR